MNLKKFPTLIIAICSAFCAITPNVNAQGILAQPTDAQDGMPFTPQVPGMAPGFSLPSMSSYNLPIPAGMRPIQAFTADFFKQATATRLGAGTVLTGILEDDLSSGKNQVGDVFSIRLENGYSANGVVIIPPQSKVLGSIISVKPARMQKFGAPGAMDISLQTIVFPDGRSARIYGFVEHNPAMDLKTKNGTGSAMSGPIHTVKASALSVFSGLNQKTGLPIQMPNMRTGLDFTLAKGELLPVRLNRTCDLSNMAAPPVIPGTAMAPASMTSFTPLTDGMPPTAPPIGQAATAGLLPGLAPGEDSHFGLSAPVRPMPQSDLPDPF
ncbi:MAG: hypothetical protein JST89_21890 [Cyanobacteria bacterium SZAS-4]|nr:hypothetical protein [Cyanobacteria bacterium SZAS-4]